MTGALLSSGAARTVGFKPHLRVEVVAGEAVYLLSERGTTALQGAHVESLAPLLDGTRTLPAVLDEVSGTLPPGEAAQVIAELARADLVGYRDPSADDSAAAYWELAGVQGASAVSSLRATVVGLVTLGRTSREAALGQCLASGLSVAPEGRQGAFTLVLCDDYLDPRLRELDGRLRAEGRPWLLAKPCGTEAWVGPVFGPGDRACWSCLAHRLRARIFSQAPVRQALGLPGAVPVPDASLPVVRGLGLHTAVLEAVKWVAGMRYEEQGAVCTLDTRTLRTRHHAVLRRPQCPECGDPFLVARQVRRPVVLRSRPKAASAGGNDRALPPEEMLSRHRHLIGPVTGVVPEVRRAPGTPEGLNRYVSGRNAALQAFSLGGVRGGMRGQSGGKGTTPLEAEVGALCEAVERYSGTRQGDEPVVRDTLAGLGATAVHPNACQLFADRQFRERERWNARSAPFHRVPPPFDPHEPAEWTPVWSLTAGEHRLLPTSMLYYDLDSRGRARAPWADSNGCAAGSSLEDAVVQGFLELVERDAVALWWYNRTRQPGVDLDAFDEPWLARIRQAYGRLGREMWVLDVTSDLGIPAMAAMSRLVGDGEQGICVGFGAHFDARLALRRAVTELGQLLPVGEEGRQARASHPDMDEWWRNATVENQPYLVADYGQGTLGPTSYEQEARSDLRADVEAAERLVRAHGMELLVLDQTRPDLGVPVAKVIVPGMRHFWARFAPGRLFDTPVRLGRLSRPTAYDDLNPVPLFV
ncbi:TOMM precursor leader peptide-binding protein [Streptomyces sp. NPDC018610]|uniref:TOMM precursor leader peptide-binding protein n=1 Tax=Streptomyces sp. NPDC018610 TaxID=3365049 RepID=UPI00378C8DE6